VARNVILAGVVLLALALGGLAVAKVVRDGPDLIVIGPTALMLALLFVVAGALRAPPPDE
jgi:hypothetical protein